jgi:replicative DNA helicase
MASPENQVLSRIIRNGDLHAVLDWGITSDDFRTAQGRAMFSYLVSYYHANTTAGAVPGAATLRDVYPMFELVDDAHMTTPALCTELRKQRISIEAKELAKHLAEEADIDPLLATTQAQGKLTQLISLGLSKNTDVTFSSSYDTMLTKYVMTEEGYNFAKCPWPWQIMNDVTGGLQEDDYIVLYGRPKSKKSWVLASFIGFLFDMDRRMIVYTKEMTPENIFRRTAACILGLPYHELRMAQLLPHQREDLFALRDLIAVRMQQNIICLSAQDTEEGSDTIPWIQAKIEKYKPDACFIDGLYLLSSTRKLKSDHERVMDISRQARRMQLATKVPLICTMQANRPAAKHQDANLDEIAYSDAIAQDATCAIRVISEKVQPTIAMILAGSREFQLHGFRIGGVPATDFSFKEVLTEKQIKKAHTQDGTENESEDPKQQSRPRPAIRKPDAKANGASSNATAAVDYAFGKGAK